jgi:glycosyltransferase involved in cell wall biosynthesis
MRDPLVNIVVPVYNEERRLVISMPKLLAFLQAPAFTYRHVITVVDNGSTDATAEIARGYARDRGNIRLISLKKKGKGHAVRTAWSECVGDIQMFMDVDLATDLTYAKDLIDAISRDGYDMAVGDRLGTHSHVEGRNPLRALFSKIFNALVRWLLRSRLRDHQCGFKAMRTDSYKKIAHLLQEDGFFFDAELVVHAQRAGQRIRTIDVRWTENRDSKVSVVKTSLEMFAALLRVRRRLNRS